jgi:hypothetical protein
VKFGHASDLGLTIMYVRSEENRFKKVEEGFPVSHLDIDRLLGEWRWLCPEKMGLIARNAYGDLFLTNEGGAVFWLDVSGGKLSKIAVSEVEFRASAATKELRELWFAEADEERAALRGLIPNADQCIGFATPIVFKEASSGNKPYVIDLYEGVSFLGHLHQQVRDVPDGGKVRLLIKPKRQGIE